MNKILTRLAPRFASGVFRNNMNLVVRSSMALTLSTLALKWQHGNSSFATNADSSNQDDDLENSLKEFEKFLESKRGKIFTLSLGSMDFIPRGSSFTTRVKHPNIAGWLNLIFVKSLEGEVTVFRANCPYENDKIIRKGLVYGNKLICEHHGCEFDIETGLVEKYPAMNNMVKIKLVKAQRESDKQSPVLPFFSNSSTKLTLYREDQVQKLKKNKGVARVRFANTRCQNRSQRVQVQAAPRQDALGFRWDYCDLSQLIWKIRLRFLILKPKMTSFIN